MKGNNSIRRKTIITLCAMVLSIILPMLTAVGAQITPSESTYEQVNKCDTLNQPAPENTVKKNPSSGEASINCNDSGNVECEIVEDEAEEEEEKEKIDHIAKMLKQNNVCLGVEYDLLKLGETHYRGFFFTDNFDIIPSHVPAYNIVHNSGFRSTGDFSTDTFVAANRYLLGTGWLPALGEYTQHIVRENHGLPTIVIDHYGKIFDGMVGEFTRNGITRQVTFHIEKHHYLHYDVDYLNNATAAWTGGSLALSGWFRTFNFRPFGIDAADDAQRLEALQQVSVGQTTTFWTTTAEYNRNLPSHQQVHCASGIVYMTLIRTGGTNSNPQFQWQKYTIGIYDTFSMSFVSTSAFTEFSHAKWIDETSWKPVDPGPNPGPDPNPNPDPSPDPDPGLEPDPGINPESDIASVSEEDSDPEDDSIIDPDSDEEAPVRRGGTQEKSRVATTSPKTGDTASSHQATMILSALIAILSTIGLAYARVGEN